MKAVTLWQPWASQVFDTLNPKDVENRKNLMPPADLLEEDWIPPNPPVEGVARVKGLRPFFAVHAGKVYDDGPALAAAGRGTAGRWPFPPGVPVPRRDALPYGAVVGIARVRHAWDARAGIGVSRGVVAPNEFELCRDLPKARWWLGPIGWRLMDAIRIEPVACKGALGVWTLGPDVEAQVRANALRAVKAELDARAYVDAPHGSPHLALMPWLEPIDLANAYILLGGTPL